MTYTPTSEQLDRYAHLLVGYALGGGDGISAGDVVAISCEESAKPLYGAACRAVWSAGGNVISQYAPDNTPELNIARDFFAAAAPTQLDFYPERHMRGMIDDADHLLRLHADSYPRALAGVDPAALVRNRRARRRLNEWIDEKENAGQFTWTIALYGTEAMADEAGMSLEEYWGEIASACFLDDPDPIARWREVGERITGHCEALNALPIERLHVEGEDVDLWLTVGEQRRWLGGGGRNLPSFEVFTSPDWRGTEGWIRFSEPLYWLGSLIKGVELEFRAGVVVASRASENEALLREMIATENADKVGEFSLTDARLSPIRRFMANTLFDENTGGPFGNTHVAIGQAISATYAGDPAAVADGEWERLGFNRSAIHTDIVSTTDRTVTATLAGGGEQVIYSGGRFTHE
jgi:aminopeptidase